ncbi:uncharacterized protein LOC108668661 [Hyalella azteca]|uniref:Uncharacterized protein LOC108668661 n=1 Tax=Hyalella azteca TaxID=294128 RepID=A0A8B7NCS3_HYAAZ|nr:uncharacterized protein LOC108668661 [Hyalella azteca]
MCALSMWNSLDIEKVERAQKDSTASSDSDIIKERFLVEDLSFVNQAEPSFSNTPEEIKIIGKEMDYSPLSQNRQEGNEICSEEVCNKFFIWKLRFLHTIMAAVLVFVGMQQIERPDAAVWIPLFTVPAVITLLSTLKVTFIDGVCMRSLVSVYLGSAICLLIFLATSLLVVMAKQTYDVTYNPLNFQEGREMMAVAVCVGWQKFHLFTVKEQARVTRNQKGHQRPATVSAQAMLKRLLTLIIIPGALFFATLSAVRFKAENMKG